MLSNESDGRLCILERRREGSFRDGRYSIENDAIPCAASWRGSQAFLVLSMNIQRPPGITEHTGRQPTSGGKVCVHRQRSSRTDDVGDVLHDLDLLLLSDGRRGDNEPEQEAPERRYQ